MDEKVNQPPELVTVSSALTQRVYLAEDLLQGQKEVIIRYQDSDYRLRLTKTGKLLLTK